MQKIKIEDSLTMFVFLTYIITQPTTPRITNTRKQENYFLFHVAKILCIWQYLKI